MDEKVTAKTLTASATRSYGRIVNMFHKLKNMGFRTYDTLYNSYAVYGIGALDIMITSAANRNLIC